jgi:hypothetical protein
MLNLDQRKLRQIGMTLAASAFVTSLLLTFSVLAGDNVGRVNLLYLLILFAFIPFAGLLVSLVFVFRKPAGGGLAGMLLDLPFWPRQWRREISILAQTPALKSWFFYQTQAVALSFGLGALAALFLLLLGSDVSFVWRSTLLEARQIFPVLSVLGWPWSFWDSAQPSLELLQQTQDFRLAPQQAGDVQVFGQWWQYVLAAQCTYNLLPRSLMLLGARWWYRRQLATAHAATSSAPSSSGGGRNTVTAPGKPAALTHSVQTPFVLVDWAGAPAFCHAWLDQHFGKPERVLETGPATANRVSIASPGRTDNPVVLVKSWEPPMGELKDYLEEYAHGGLVLPLDWDATEVQPVKLAHLEEWQRFCGTLQDWRVLQAGDGS